MGPRLAAGPGRDVGIISEGCGPGSSQSMADMWLAFICKADCAQPSELSPTDKCHRERMQTRQRTIRVRAGKVPLEVPSLQWVGPTFSEWPWLLVFHRHGWGGHFCSPRTLCSSVFWVSQKKKLFLMASVNASPGKGSRAGLVQFPSFRETEALGRKAAPFKAPCSQALSQPVM